MAAHPHKTGNATTSTPYDLRAFDVADADIVQHKLATMRTLSPKDLMLVADFDNTLTKRGHSVWEALRNALPEEGRLESDIERNHNMAKEHNGELTVEEVILWSKHELSRYAKYGITIANIKEAARQLKLRQGARKLFDVCTNAGIESHILSASVMDAIEYVTTLKHIQATHVHSNRLHTKDGACIEWDEGNMFHSLNKHEYALRVILGGVAPEDDPRYKIVLGDNRHDADMVAGDNALRIRVQGKKGNTKDYLTQSFSTSNASKGFDLVLRTEGLLPVVDLLQWLVA